MVNVPRGAVQVGKIAGVPVRLHWSVLLGAVVFTGFSFSPVRWICLVGLIVAHEVGHALVVKASGARAIAIDVNALGGLCHWQGRVSALGRAAIAWGGVWAQLVILVVALFADGFTPAVRSDVTEQVLWTLTVSNAWLIGFNLLPFSPLDGADAWQLPILLGVRARRRLSGKIQPVQVQRSLEQRDAEFDTGARQPEVSAIVSSLLDDAREDQP